jgi:hypothetical protein
MKKKLSAFQQKIPSHPKTFVGYFSSFVARKKTFLLLFVISLTKKP